MTPQEYRVTHPRCKYCKYCKIIIPPSHICSDYYKCLIKEKVISELFWNWRGIFCKCYKPEEINFDI